MNDMNIPVKADEAAVSQGKEFKGYTLDELKYQRALVTLQKDFCKSRLLRITANLQKSNPLSPMAAASSIPGKVGFFASKFLRGLNYLDYAMLGFSIFGGVRKIISIFRKKKRK